MLSVSSSQKIVSKRLKKKPARPRSSIGRSHITKQCTRARIRMNSIQNIVTGCVVNLVQQVYITLVKLPCNKCYELL